MHEVLLLKNGDILITRSGTIGISCLVENIPYDCIFASYLIRFRPIIINPKYIYYYLQSEYYWSAIIQEKSGVSIPNVNATQLAKLKIPLPPLKEQNKIVLALDTIIEKLNSFSKRLDTIPNLLNRYRGLVMEKAVNGELTESWREKNKDNIQPVIIEEENHSINETYKKLTKLPANWKWVALGNYAKCSRGRFSARPRNDPQYYTGKYPFIQIGDLPKEGGFINKHKQTLNQKGLKVSKKFSKNTVAIAIVGATIGNTGILSYDMCFPDSLIGIDSQVDYSNYYIEYYFRIEKENLRSISYSSGGQPNIKIPILNSYPFPLPPLEEQKEIVKEIEKLLKKADKLEEFYKSVFHHFKQIKTTILEKAFSGKLISFESVKPSVSILLENITSEKTRYNFNQNDFKKSRKRMKKNIKTNQSIYDVLLKNGEMPAGDVWKKSRHSDDIEKFYKELREEMEIKKRVKESKIESGESSLLSIKK